MAYKFQVGAAKLSGSVQLTDGQIASTDVDDTTAANIVTQIDAGEIPIAKLAASTISGVSLGNNLNSLSKATNGGVNFTSYNGSAAVSNLQLDLADLAAASVAVGADSIAIIDADDDSSKKESIADLMTAVAGNGLAASSGVLAVGVDDSSLEINSDALRVKASGVTNAMLAGSIANAKLANSAVTVTAGDGLQGGGSVSLGGSVTLNIDVDVIAGVGLTADNTNEELDVSSAQTGIESIYNAALIVGRGASDAHIDFSTDNQIQFDIDNTATMNLSANGINVQQGGIQVPAGADVDVAGAGAASLYPSVGANNLTLGGSTSTVVIPGNLTVSGTTVEIDAAFVVTSSIQFEGSTNDGNEITLTSADPSSDKTITLPDLTGHIPLIAGAIGNANVTSAEFLLLDGGSSIGTDGLADGDGFLHNDNGTMKQTQVVKIAELAFSKVSGDATVSSAGALTIAANAVEGSMLNNNVISGQTDIGAAIVSTDELLISDGGTIRRTDMSRLKTYIGSGTAAISEIGDADATLAVGVNVSNANLSAARTWTLPASAGMTAGESVKVKVAGLGGATLTIARAGSQTIDGSLTSIKLESDNAAVELVYVGSDDWRVF